MARELKFRGWDSFHKTMITPYCELRDGSFWGEDCTNTGISVAHENVMQFTGRKDKDGKDIYEGDIFRVEEDQENLIYYLVVVWVNEWSMFCVLRCDDEYQEYLRDGVEALDEPMFWTYTLEDTADRKFYLCGNIYETPDLINYAGGAVLDR